MSNYHLIEVQFATAKQPVYTERKSGGMVNYGDDNTYPNYLDELYNQSPKHGAIVKSKVVYIFGKGLSGVNELAPANAYGDTWNEILKKCIADDEKYGGYYLQVIWGKGRTIAAVHHLKFPKVRTNQDNTTFWVKDEWDFTKQLTRKDKALERKYSAFDINDRKGTQILFVKQEGTNDVYPLPSYFQALNYIDADRLMSRHILGMAKDGFVASKLINFNNGEPTPEQKKAIEDGIAKKFTGSEGKKFMLSFNKNAESQVVVSDLGTSQLTKEDFTNINNLIQQEIFASHQITSPILFGIKTEGQLGARSELRDAYEIFRNTYVNERQQVHEDIFNGLINLTGQVGERKIIPTEPIGIDISESMIVSLNLPKKYFYDKLGINIEDYPEIGEPSGVTATGMVNDHLKNLSGRQMQNINRIVRQYEAGKITRTMAIATLKSGFGLSDEDIVAFIGEENMQFSEQDLIQHFSEVNENRSDYVLLNQYPFNPESDYFNESFAEVSELSTIEATILDLISKDKNVTNDVLAKAVKKPLDVVETILKGLEDNGLINVKGDVRTITKPLSEIPKPKTTGIMVRYSYEWKSEIPYDQRDSANHPSRPFCVKMMELSKTKVWSRQNIEQISARVGYSVWDRLGGWWTMPNGQHSISCRHQWKANILLKKK